MDIEPGPVMGAPPGALLVRLRQRICDAYDEFAFGELVMETYDPIEFDFFKLSPSTPFAQRVLETVRWINNVQGMEGVYAFARIVASRREKRRELAELVAQLAAVVGVPAPGAPPPGPGATPEELALPPELEGALDVFEEGESTLAALARDLRTLLRSRPSPHPELPGRLHLSESDGRRLAAVIALERNPDPVYLRWLSERVTVEEPTVAFASVQALTAAALWLQCDQPVVARLRAALQGAADRLDLLMEEEGASAPGFDVSARKRQLQAAMALLEARTVKGRSVLPTAELERFLGALVESFDQGAFDSVCRKHLQTPLKRLANPEDPLELIVVAVWLAARDRGWEEELIAATCAEGKGNPVLAQIGSRFAVAGEAVGEAAEP